MEDEGTLSDHLSGIAVTDGNWHHIAVTWQSSTGDVILYLDSREVWRVKRGQGKRIPSGGTLVIGREQVGSICRQGAGHSVHWGTFSGCALPAIVHLQPSREIG